MSKILLYVITSLVSFAGAAFADAPLSCLQRASDQQLLDEVASRMGGGGNPTPLAQVSARCDSSAFFHVAVTNLESGKEVDKSFSTGSASLCDKAVALVMRKTGGQGLQNNLMIGFCDSSAFFTRLLLKTTGEIQEMGSTSTGSMSKCQAAMDQL